MERHKYIAIGIIGIIIGIVLWGGVSLLHPNCSYTATPAPVDAGADGTGSSGPAADGDGSTG